MIKPSPISIQFVWHPDDAEIISPVLQYCKENLSRNSEVSFLHSLDFPLFYFTSSSENTVPASISTMSEKSLVFAFVSDSMVASEAWDEYINSISDFDNVKLVPVALTTNAFKIKSISGINHIRFYDYYNESNLKIRNQRIFIDIAHEIYRWLLNSNNDRLNLFLSHTKKDVTALNLANELREVISSDTKLDSFFDTNDLQSGDDFNDDIKKSINKSTLIIIHSDNYSSRYWCQREVVYAKQNKRPIIEVNNMNGMEDRSFPLMCNYPSIRYNDNPLSVLELALLETIRFFYCEKLMETYKANNYIPKDSEIYSSVPDRFTINDSSSATIIYPEPELYAFESDLIFSQKTIRTPLSSISANIKSKKIGISISDAPSDDLLRLGQDQDHLKCLSKIIAQKILRNGACLIYGGDLRPNGFTQFLFDEAEIVNDRMTSSDVLVKNYVPWPVVKTEMSDIKSWSAKYRGVCEFIRCDLPEGCTDIDENNMNGYVWSRCLLDMRKKMISSCDVRICAGGKTTNYKGSMPGILEEVILAVGLHKPIYLLGGFGGITARICDYLQTGVLPDELKLEWQKKMNTGYDELLKTLESKGIKVNYDSLLKINIKSLNNGLNEKENKRLFKTPFFDEAICLISRGLGKIYPI